VPTSKDQKQRRVNNPTLWDFCVSVIERADIEGSKATSQDTTAINEALQIIGEGRAFERDIEFGLRRP
jgi:hypothetical protein